jgi:hypothetical protein
MMRRFRVLQPLRGVRRVDEARLETRHVQLRGRQQRAELVVQLPCEVATFVFPHLLEVGREFGQAGGALLDLGLERVAFALQRLLLALADRSQDVRLPQVEVEGDERNDRDQRDAHAGQAQRPGDLRLSAAQRGVAAVDQGAGLGADRDHLFAAHVGGDDEFPGFFLAVLAQPDAHVHLGHLAADVRGKLREAGVLGGARSVEGAQGAQLAVDLAYRLVVGFAILQLAGQQIAALTRFSIDNVQQKFVERLSDALGIPDLDQRLMRLAEADLVDAHQHQRGQSGQREAQGHLRKS